MNSRAGFTLIEMLIVIAIVGILGAAALPYYQGYAIQSKLTEVERAIMTVKSAVSVYRQEEEIWPNCPDIVALRTTLGIGIGALGRVSALSVSDGVITATVANIHTMVNNKTLSLTPTLSLADGSFRWTWGWSPDFPVHLRPKRD